MAFRSGKVKDVRSLKPLKDVLEKFNTVLNRLLVKTPSYTDEDLMVDPEVVKFGKSLNIT